MNYQYCCVNCGSKLKELEYLIDHAKQITWGTFRKYVSVSIMPHRDQNPHISKDWAVSFYKSKLRNGKKVYYYYHSAIEYVFY